jgi:hypothetical protein
MGSMKPEDKMIEKWRRMCREIEDEFGAKIREWGRMEREDGASKKKDVDVGGEVNEGTSGGHKLRRRRPVVWRKSHKEKVVIRVGTQNLNPETSKVAHAFGTYLLESSRLSQKENEANSVVYDSRDYTNAAGHTEPVAQDTVGNAVKEKEKVDAPRETVKIVLNEKVRPVACPELQVVADTPKSFGAKEEPAIALPQNTKHAIETTSEAEEKTATSHRTEDAERTVRATDEENEKLKMAFLQLKSQCAVEKAPERWVCENPPLVFKEKSLYKAAVINSLRKSPFRAPRFHPNLYKPQTEVPPIDSDDELSMDLGFSVPLWAKNPRLNEEVRAQVHDELSLYFKNADPVNVNHMFPNVKNVTNDSPNKWEPNGR